MTFGEKFRKFRKDRKLGQRILSRRAGCVPSEISRIEHDTYIPRVEMMSKFAKGFRVPLSELINTTGFPGPNVSYAEPTKLPSNAIVDNYVKIPVIGSIACGNPEEAIRTTDEYRLAPKSFVKGRHCFYLRANGDSMLPKIQNGSLVMIEANASVENKDIVAISINDSDATLKRVVKNGTKVVAFHPDNPAFDDIFPSNDNKCRIIGKAIAVQNKLD